MDFKRRMLQMFASKVNQEFGEYKAGYRQILRDTVPDIEDSHVDGSPVASARTELRVEYEDDNTLSFVRRTIDGSSVGDKSQKQGQSGVKCPATLREETNAFPGMSFAPSDPKKHEDEGLTEERDVNALKMRPIISKCTVDETLLEDESKLFDNSMNMHMNQTFFGEFRRKARRRTGKLIVKRRFYLVDGSEDTVKRIKTEKIPSFYEACREASDCKGSVPSSVHLKELEDLKVQLRAAEELLRMKREKEEKEEVERIRQEGAEASKRIELEMEKLMGIKKDISQELKKIETERKRIQEEKDKMHAERLTAEKKRLEDEFLVESKRLDAEKTMIADEKRKLEEFKMLESKRLEEERLRVETEKLEELRRIQASRENLELKLVEETKKIQIERKLIEEEREKINQTFLEITSRSARGPLKPKEVKIQLPPLFGIPGSASVGVRPKPLNELFLDAKREHAEKDHRPVLGDSTQCSGKANPVIGQAAQRLHHGAMNIEKMSPHCLYKSSIDAQAILGDPKKYIPKTPIPFYANEDEFDTESKKFSPASFTKDPRLNFVVKNQNHEEIKAFFGNKRDIDVETIFSEIENVSNQSPNKLRT